MSAAADLERLDDIEARMASPMVTYKENVTQDMPVLTGALRAVLALVDAADPRGRRQHEGLLTPAEIRTAITTALTGQPPADGDEPTDAEWMGAIR